MNKSTINFEGKRSNHRFMKLNKKKKALETNFAK